MFSYLRHHAVGQFDIVRSLGLDRAVVEAGLCGRFFALTSQCEGIERSIPEALRKARGLLKKCRNVFKKDFGV
ncbi:hypothetical protein BACCOPRO_02473 [Phocaeicola coprophilus DSM 18228 = JCM 13818]|uniref:Uncharacterized protein n=1 Tax=Phocaeicola coprophilus DSM 18228 = JCM 13818 TaxID=547042 RepID=S0FE36_9BACT|nr:hypothetical protein BACCOPRO_02473 [Phocaeicola coprophilus DSM 18228 = JCM 13818]